MNRNKCNRCGLINSVSDENCRRCKTNLRSAENAPPRYPSAPPVADIDVPKKKRSIVISLAIGMLTAAIISNFHSKDDEKIRMNSAIENDRKRQYEMSVDRERESDKEKLDRYYQGNPR